MWNLKYSHPEASWERFPALEYLIKEMLFRKRFGCIFLPFKTLQTTFSSFLVPFPSITSKVRQYYLCLLESCVFSRASLAIHGLPEFPEGAFLESGGTVDLRKSRKGRSGKGLGKEEGRGPHLFSQNWPSRCSQHSSVAFPLPLFPLCLKIFF